MLKPVDDRTRLWQPAQFIFDSDFPRRDSGHNHDVLGILDYL